MPVAARAQPDNAGATDALQQILERAGRYVVGYAEAFKNILATEDYRQTLREGPYGRPLQRMTRADVMVVTLPGALPWVTFRDVYEVDGREVPDRGKRLEKVFTDSPGSAVAQARALLEASARYNLGRLRRMVNVPTLALLFLQPDNRERFSFERKGERLIGGVKTVEVAFDERQRPTLIRGDSGNDVPSKGRFWIDPTDGAVLRTEVIYKYTSAGPGVGATSARITTEYLPDPKLGIRVPVEMQESYDVKGSGAEARQPPRRDGPVAPEDVPDRIVADDVYIQATARYSAYHRFEIQTQELFRAAPEASPE